MIRENLLKLKKRVSSACAKAKVNPQAVEIVAVAKGRSVGQIKEALACGITNIGENKVQEALSKYNEIRNTRYEIRSFKYHMVGHLQTNKVKEAVEVFDLIQSVDSTRLAEAIDREAGKIGKIQEILLEVKTSPEATKFGIEPQQLLRLTQEIGALKNIKINGLMTMAPLAAKPEDARPFFRLLRELFIKLSTINYRLSTISMGMTDDFEVAIEEGATMIRIGRAIFER